MLKVFALIFFVLPLAALGKVLNVEGVTVERALQMGQCHLRVEKAPIKFEKGVLVKQAGSIGLFVHEVDHVNVRLLEVGRTMRISRISDNEEFAKMDDPSISSVQLGKTSQMKVSEVETKSRGNLKIICVDDEPISF